MFGVIIFKAVEKGSLLDFLNLSLFEDPCGMFNINSSGSEIPNDVKGEKVKK